MLGETARKLRESLNLTQKAAAELLGVTDVHLCNVENNRTAPSQKLIDKYRELWDVDLYVMAWCLHGDVTKLPDGIRKAAKGLGRVWQQHLDNITRKHRRSAG